MEAPTLRIRPYEESDEGDVHAAFVEAVDEGGSFPFRPPVVREQTRRVWIERKSAVAVARLGDEFAGAYYVRQNFAERAGWIANAGYLVPKAMRGRGVGRALLDHSLAEARRLGFGAMMFNLVFDRNPARRLWEAAGFEEIGRIPGAIDGEQDALIYFKRL
jgi:GNAT superfamily N-acetyltransferase